MNEKINLSAFYIKCIWCNKNIKLSDAVKEGWKLCIGCNIVFCPSCQQQYENQESCPGSAYSKPHTAVFSFLPIEQIIDFAKEINLRQKEGRYISKIFFNPERTKIWFRKNKKTKSQDTDINLMRFRREQWAKFGVVLVKRKEDGKFLTWGQID